MKKILPLVFSAMGIVAVLPVFAIAATSEQIPPSVIMNTQCMQQATNTRGSALINAFDVFHDAVTLALKNRITAESGAWEESDSTTRNSELRDASKSFDETYHKASKNLNRQKHAAWQQFESDSHTCRTGRSNHASSSSVPPPVTVSEEVHCVFSGSTTEQRCDNASESDTPFPFSCSGVANCIAHLKGPKGLPVFWKSTCGGSATTTLDGTNKYITFSCGQTSVPTN